MKRAKEQGCPCGKCEPGPRKRGLRDCPATDVELALLAKARRTTDPVKIAAFMPAWLKRSLYKPPARFRFVPDKAPVLPRLPTGAAWRKVHDPHFRELADPFDIAAPNRDNTSAYAAAYYSAVGFRV